MEKIGKMSFNRAQLLGTGRFGKIFVGKYKNSEVAIKRVEKSKTEMNCTLYMKLNGHPNIIQYYGDSSKDVEFRYMAVEICCGNLEDLIKQKYDGPTVGSTLEVLRQIAKGVHHLHLLDIVHGDLKPSNILVSCSKGDLKPMMKLTDFGLRHVFQRAGSNGEKPPFRQATTKGWFCPADQVDGQLSPPFDIFPLGNLFYYTASKGTHAFGSSFWQIMSRMYKKKPVMLDLVLLDESVRCAAFLDLVGKMLYFDASKRPTASEIVNHEIFNKDQQDFSNWPSTSRLSTQSALEEDEQSDRLPAESDPEPSSSSQSRVIVKQEDFNSSEEDEISQAHKKRRIPQPLVRDYDYESSGSSSTQQSGTKKSKSKKLKTSNIKEEASADPILHSVKKEKEKSDSDNANEMDIPSAEDQRELSVATGSSFGSQQHHNDLPPQSVEQDRYSSASYQSRHSQSSLDSKGNDYFPSQFPYEGMTNNSQPYIRVRPFQCGSCPKRFFRFSHLKNHQRREHLPPSYLCNFCHCLFQRPYRLKLHERVDRNGFVECRVLRKQLSHSNSNN